MSRSLQNIFWIMSLMIACLLPGGLTYGQFNDSTSSVAVIKDSRIDILTKKQAQINKTSVFKNSAGKYKGYRVMVISTNDRELAYKTRSDILRYFPDKGVYMGYQSPYFKLKAGDFIKKEDAEKFRKELSKFFSGSLFVMPDIIILRPEDEAWLMSEDRDTKRF